MEIQKEDATQVYAAERVENVNHIDRVPTIEVENYHGLSITCILVYIVSKY